MFDISCFSAELQLNRLGCDGLFLGMSPLDPVIHHLAPPHHPEMGHHRGLPQPHHRFGSAVVVQENMFIIVPFARTAPVDGLHELHEQSGSVLLRVRGLMLLLLLRDSPNQLLLALQDAGKLL